MKVSSWLWIGAVAALTAAGIFHLHTTERQSQLDAEERRLRQGAADTRRRAADTSLQIAVARQALERLTAARARPPSPATVKPADATPPATISAKPNPPTRAMSAEIRQMQVQAFVSEQRLRFAALLRRLGLDAKGLQDFDRLQEEYQRIALDETKTEAERTQARQRREAQLQELFGPAYDQWLEASRTDPARRLVAQIVQQTFQGSGALTTMQAEQLVQLFDGHRLQSSNRPGTNAARYDWDGVVSDARAILAERQMKDFVTAIQFQRASEQMSAMAAPKKS